MLGALLTRSRQPSELAPASPNLQSFAQMLSQKEGPGRRKGPVWRSDPAPHQLTEQVHRWPLWPFSDNYRRGETQAVPGKTKEGQRVLRPLRMKPQTARAPSSTHMGMEKGTRMGEPPATKTTPLLRSGF